MFIRRPVQRQSIYRSSDAEAQKHAYRCTELDVVMADAFAKM